MDDYDWELENARIWDDDLKGIPSTTTPSKFHWQTIGHSDSPAEATETNKPTHVQGTAPRQQHRSGHFPRRLPPKRGSRNTTNRPPRVAHALTLPPRLIDHADNTAELAWRARKPHSDVIRIPIPIVMADRESNNPTTFERIAKHHGAYIFTDEAKNVTGSLTFGIWGEAGDAAAAKAAIVVWIDSVSNHDSKSIKSASFHKLVSLTPEMRERAEKKWKAAIKQSRFRRFPPEDMPFEMIGSFHWPSTQYSALDAFGASCEALDPIRMSCECYIQFDSERSLFQVCGKMQKVKDALLRIRQTCFQISARAINQARLYLLRWPDTSEIASHVYLEEVPAPRAVKAENAGEPEVKPQLSPRAQGTLVDVELIEREAMGALLHKEHVRATLENALNKIHYYRGHLDLRVRLGTFVLRRYRIPRDGMYELEEYEAMVKSSQFLGFVTEEIGNLAVEQRIFNALQQAGDFIRPDDALTKKISDVKATYSGIFVFEHEKGHLRLTVSFEQQLELDDRIGPGYSQAGAKWVRLQRDAGREANLLDLSLTNLHNGLAFQFELAACDALDISKVPEHLRMFAATVGFEPKSIRNNSFSEKPFITFNPFVQPKSLRQCMTYQYGIKDSDYSIRLTQYQDRVYGTRSTVLEPSRVTVYEPRWGLSVTQHEWEHLLSENESMHIGKQASWSHDLDKWFSKRSYDPEDRDGFTLFLEKLAKVEHLLDSIAEKDEEDLMG